MPEPTREEKLRLLTILLESRHGDLREQNLNRQGKGHFHVSGMGHEAVAAISIQMQEDDYIVPFYRDRVGNQTGWEKCCCSRDRWRCRHPPRRFLRSYLFRERKEIATLVRRRGQ